MTAPDVEPLNDNDRKLLPTTTNTPTWVEAGKTLRFDNCVLRYGPEGTDPAKNPALWDTSSASSGKAKVPEGQAFSVIGKDGRTHVRDE